MDINDFNWHDYCLNNIFIDYSDIIIEVEEEKTFWIVCSNYIGIQYLGQWDENIIESITKTRQDPLIDVSKSEISKKNDIKQLGGGTRNYLGDWECINIKLLDGICIKIICSESEVREYR